MPTPTEPVAVTWRLSPLAAAIAISVVISLTLAVLVGSWQLVVFASPLVGVLAAAFAVRPAECRFDPGVPPTVRCFEGESIDVHIPELSCADAVVTIKPRWVAPMQVQDRDADRLTVAAPRWGRYPIALDVRLSTVDGMHTCEPARVLIGVVQVFPLAPAELTELPPTELPGRVGTHRTPRHGAGVEFAEVAEYTSGEPLRAVNWRVSARRGRLYVTRRFTDRSADVVVVLDRHEQAPGPASEAMDRVVRGATQIAGSALQRGDRLGVVVLGQRVRWLAPDLGRRQFYRILEVLLDAQDEVRSSAGTVIPPASLPRGAVVVALSTLLDAEFALAMVDVRRRGSPVVVVDVLQGTPFIESLPAELVGLWRMERAGMYRDLRASGVSVSAWPADTELAAVLSGPRHLMRASR